jgi:hypothetical protein
VGKTIEIEMTVDVKVKLPLSGARAGEEACSERTVTLPRSASGRPGGRILTV